MPIFWVGDEIKAKLIEAHFRCHMQAILNATRYVIRTVKSEMGMSALFHVMREIYKFRIT